MRVLLVHGMGRTPFSMARLTRFLRRAGHRPERLAYVAALESYERILGRVRRRLETLAQSGEPYAVIGHSLGGLTLRAALADLDPAPAHFIMLATPNRPPLLAQRLHRLWPYRLLCGECGQLLSRPEFFDGLPVPRVPYTIIAGDGGYRGRRGPFGGEPNDWLVAVEETKISPADQPTVLPVGHTFIMNNARVLAAIERALNHTER
jgi:Alpha/beta hydrolase family